MKTDFKLKDNVHANRYEINVDGFTAKIEYMKAGNKIFLTHTEVPEEFEGGGVGSALVKAVLEDIERKNLILVPLCPFVSVYVKRHPEWEKLINK